MSSLARRTPTAVAYGAVVLAAILGPRELFLVVVGLLVAVALAELLRLTRAGAPVIVQAAVLIGGAAALVFLRDLGAFPYVPVLMTVLAVWAADVAGYGVGSVFGRRKIAPSISPGKTWEGTVAGFVAAAAVVLLFNLPAAGMQAWWVVAAVLIGPVALSGDLLESWIKRRAGVKDSGAILPGHGGVLDRIDSLVAAAPLVAGAILLLGRLG